MDPSVPADTRSPWLDRHPDWKEHRQRVEVDAEKAFIKALAPRYNEEKYLSYPKSTDGLWGKGYPAYHFTILENMTFKADTATFRGSRSTLTTSHSDVECLFVNESEVREVPLTSVGPLTDGNAGPGQPRH